MVNDTSESNLLVLSCLPASAPRCIFWLRQGEHSCSGGRGRKCKVLLQSAFWYSLSRKNILGKPKAASLHHGPKPSQPKRLRSVPSAGQELQLTRVTGKYLASHRVLRSLCTSGLHYWLTLILGSNLGVLNGKTHPQFPSSSTQGSEGMEEESFSPRVSLLFRERSFQGDTVMFMVCQSFSLPIPCSGGLFGLLLCISQGCLCQKRGRWFCLKGILSLTGSTRMDRLWLCRMQWVFMWGEIPEGQYWLFITYLKYLPCICQYLGLRQILMTEVTSHSVWVKNMMLS